MKIDPRAKSLTMAMEEVFHSGFANLPISRCTIVSHQNSADQVFVPPQDLVPLRGSPARCGFLQPNQMR